MWLKFWGFGFVFFNLIPLFNFAVMVFFWSCGEGAVFLCCPLGAAVRLVVFAPEHRTKGSQWGFECMGQMEELKTHRYPVQGKRGAAVFLRSWELFSWPLGRGDVERPWLIWLYECPKLLAPVWVERGLRGSSSCLLAAYLQCLNVEEKNRSRCFSPSFFCFDTYLEEIKLWSWCGVKCVCENVFVCTYLDKSVQCPVWWSMLLLLLLRDKKNQEEVYFITW